jgi:hypothetical protein
MKNVYIVEDRVYEEKDVYSTYEAACKKAKEWAEYIKKNMRLGEINQEVLDDETRWYEENKVLEPVVVVYTRKLLTN